MIHIKPETQAILTARYAGQAINLEGLDLDTLFSEYARISGLDAKHKNENEEAFRRQMDLRDITQRNSLIHGEFKPEPVGVLQEDLYQEGDIA